MLPIDIQEAVTVDISDLAHLQEVMYEYGFALVSNVFSPEEVAAAEKLFDEDLRSIIDIPAEKFKFHPIAGRAKASSLAHVWPIAKAPVGRTNPLFASDFGLPQGKCAWYARTHDKVVDVFEAMFSTRDLCVGMDNVFFSNDNQQQRDEKTNDPIDYLWPHADQSVFVKPSGEWRCYQGVLYLWPSEDGSSTTVLWPRSHKTVYPDLMKQREFGSHFCMLDKGRFLEFADQAFRLRVPSGTMVLWDSRTLHQGWEGGPRLAIPICHEPVKRRSEVALASKHEACRKGLPTTHWASLGKMHSTGSTKGGGTPDFPVSARAHLWLLDDEGDVIPSIAKWL